MFNIRSKARLGMLRQSIRQTLSGNSAVAHVSAAAPTGLELEFHGQRFVRSAPASFFLTTPGSHENIRTFLGPAVPISIGEKYELLARTPRDLGVDARMCLVRRRRDEALGYILEHTLCGDMTATGNKLWSATNPDYLRSLVEVRRDNLVLYAPNLLLRRKLDDAKNRIVDAIMFGRLDTRARAEPNGAFHPLAVGSEAHRLGLFALSPACDATEKSEITELLSSLLCNYFEPACMPVGNAGALSWPYMFDFTMPWGSVLKAPWFSGYATAAIAGALACTLVLADSQRARDLLCGAISFLRLSSESGGACYYVNQFPHVNEYITEPYYPNYRTFDGELMCIPYLYNAAVLTSDDRLLAFVLGLIEGIRDALPLMSPNGDLPRFGMDGQDINSGYMLQMWFTVQSLANIAKFPELAEIAGAWARHVPDEFKGGEYPH